MNKIHFSKGDDKIKEEQFDDLEIFGRRKCESVKTEIELSFSKTQGKFKLGYIGQKVYDEGFMQIKLNDEEKELEMEFPIQKVIMQ